jgi:hypothetical protein
MNWQLCDFFETGGQMLLDGDQELAILRMRRKLLTMRIPFAYETREEYEARKRRRGGTWTPALRLWRPLTRSEMKILGC